MTWPETVAIIGVAIPAGAGVFSLVKWGMDSKFKSLETKIKSNKEVFETQLKALNTVLDTRLKALNGLLENHLNHIEDDI